MRPKLWLPTLLSLLSYFSLSQLILRHHVWHVQGFFLMSFACYVWFSRLTFSWRTLLLLAGLLRLPFFFSVPVLSDDFYRFLWDGWCLNQGLSPFTHTPSELVKQQAAYPQDLYAHLNSADYVSVYPPLHQLSFLFSFWFYEPDHYLPALTALRFLILVSEGVVYVVMRRLYRCSVRQAGLYLLSPLVVVEGVGNLHSESVLLAFLLASGGLLAGPAGAQTEGLRPRRTRRRTALSATYFAAAVATKLTPLLLLPFALLRQRRTEALVFFGVLLVCLIFFFSFFENPLGMGRGLALFFRHFEFNASVFAWVKGLGVLFTAQDISRELGPVLAVLSCALILVLSYRYRTVSFATGALWLYTVHLLFSSTVHPWYVVPLVGLGVLTPFKYPLLWSYVVLWSYVGYGSAGYEHPYLWTSTAYLLLLTTMVWEFSRLKRRGGGREGTKVPSRPPTSVSAASPPSTS